MQVDGLLDTKRGGEGRHKDGATWPLSPSPAPPFRGDPFPPRKPAECPSSLSGALPAFLLSPKHLPTFCLSSLSSRFWCGPFLSPGQSKNQEQVWVGRTPRFHWPRMELRQPARGGGGDACSPPLPAEEVGQGRGADGATAPEPQRLPGSTQAFPERPSCQLLS